MIKLNEATAFNCLAWIFANKIVNENGSPITFSQHRFLIEPYLDNSPQQAIIKCSQIGWSTLAILRSFHLAKYAKANIIHSFPTRRIEKDLVAPKVDPLIMQNPAIKAMVTEDSRNLKKIGDRFIYYRGSYDQTDAISISAHILIADEYDRSNARVLKTYRSRLDDAKRERPELGWEWQFSNPTVPGNGVDVWWNKSDQKHWFVKCSHCNYDYYLKFPDNINFDTEERICAKCHKSLSNEDLINGRWVVKHRDRKISGYWLSQMFVPWISASKIIEDSEGDKEIFHNFTLGLPYVSKDTTVTRESIIKCISPGFNPRTGAVMVIDALPYPNTPAKLAEKYPGKVFLHYFQQDKKNLGVIRWDGKVVKSDRTKIIDAVVAEINSQDVTYNMTNTALEDYIHHWEAMFRVIEKTPMGTMKPKWQTIEGRPDHFVFSTLLYRIALEKTMSFGGIIKSPQPRGSDEEGHPIINENLTVGALDLKDVLRRSQKKVMK